MKDLFVTYEQALDLKELGFDEPCFGFYDIFTNEVKGGNFPCEGSNNAPLKQQVIQWFRDKHQLFGEVVCDTTTEPKFCYVVHEFFGNPDDLTEKEWGWKDGLYSVLYRKHDQAETELIDYLIQKLKIN